MIRYLLLAAVAALIALGPTFVHAEEVLSETSTGKRIKVQAGDTLSLLAKKYLGDPMKWHALMRHNNIADPNLIDPGTVLEIPLSLKNTKTSPAEVIFATPMEIYYNFEKEGRHLQDGDFIPPSGQISANDGTALLKMPDDSKFHLEKNAIIELNGFFESKNDEGKNIFRTFLKSVQGRIKFEVSKVMGDGQFEVETPKGIIKVRGTSFAIEIMEDGDMAVETYTGAVALQMEGSTEELPIAAGEGTVVPKAASSLASVKKLKLLKAPKMNLKPTKDGGNTQFQWDAVDGAAEYVVYAGGDAEFSQPIKLGKVKGETTIVVEHLPAGSYYWNIVAIDGNGLRSPAGDPEPFQVQ